MENGENDHITQTIYDESPGFSPALLSNLRKRVAASILLENVNGTFNRTAATYYSYDVSGNVKTLYQENSKLDQFHVGNGTKRIDYEYDLISVKVNKVKYQEGKGDQFYYSYRYDADNRVVEARSSLDGLTWNTEVSYRYYLHGPLARTELGHNKVQGMDYAYTLQGWLKGVNSQELDPDKDMAGDGKAGSPFSSVGRDVLGFSLGYFNNDYKPVGSAATAFAMNYQRASEPPTSSGSYLYNGNISHITIANKLLENGAVKGYSYRYDQLNRLKQMRMHTIGAGAVSWSNSSIIGAYKEDVTYDANGNIQTYRRNGNVSNGVGFAMDNLSYNYERDSEGYLVHNRLTHVDDDPAYDGLYSVDLDDQPEDYYTYDKIGNLIKEGGTSTIKWTVYGKIREVVTNSGNIITYTYDAGGNRISKSVKQPGVKTEHTFYVRDAQGTVLGVYTRYEPSTSFPSDVNHLMWAEQHLYGSSRLGIWRPNIAMDTPTPPVPGGNGQFVVGKRAYELTNHLGNVLATISDSKTGVDNGGDGTTDYYTANVLSASDYYPFGMQMPGRTFNSESYRFGFNGKENDNEVKGYNGQQDYGMRIYDPRVGRFLSVDPITKDYPWYTPYQFAGNTPIQAIDLDGMEPVMAAGAQYGENQLAKEAAKGDKKAQERYNEVLSARIKIGVIEFGVATTLIVGPYVGSLARGAILRVTTNPGIMSAASTTGVLVTKYGPDMANFVYGATTGDANEPVPTNTDSQAADAGIAFRNLFKKGDVILDFFGGTSSRFKNGLSIDLKADFNLNGFKGTIEQFTELFKGNKFTTIVAENPYGSYNYVQAAADLLGEGGTLTVRGAESNKFFINSLKEHLKELKILTSQHLKKSLRWGRLRAVRILLMMIIMKLS